MKDFRNILFISTTEDDETSALKQALELAHNNATPLHILVLAPKLPSHFESKKEIYTDSLTTHMQETVKKACADLKIENAATDITIALESKTAPAVQIIQYVLAHKNDLVIKKADIESHGKGFKAMDMAFLRSCPCPVWLCRPFDASKKIRIAVAIDPADTESAQRALSIKLLQRARALANSYSNSSLDILSCWDYEFEDSLRHNAWLKVTEEELQKAVEEERVTNLNAQNGLIRDAGLSGEHRIHHKRGRPKHVLPEFIERNKIDILVMGTVARTGIPGFIFGNTAESILSNINCSLLAFKPDGFVSPVKPQ